VTAWLAKAEAWLLDPAAPAPELSPAREAPPPEPPARPVVAVVGLARGCGATTVARAVAVELALRDPAGASIVASEAVSPVAPPSPAAARLARLLVALGWGPVRRAGRLCLLDGSGFPPGVLPAPLVVDAGRHGAGVADRTVLVAGPGAEPALAVVASAAFERSGRAPAVVANRIEDEARWESIGALVAGESRVGAALARAGREPRGRLGAAVRELADRWEAEGW
jgi:hypothetical protein